MWGVLAHFDALEVNQYTVPKAIGRLHRAEAASSNPLDSVTQVRFSCEQAAMNKH